MCSPIDEDEKRLVALAKKMKKGNTSIDFVFFGDLDDEPTQKKLEAFNKAVKAGEGSHLVTVTPSSKLLSDQLISTPIVSGEAGGAAAAGPSGGAGGGGGGEGGEGFDYVDPNMEPELALAIRMSLEEERARQEKAAKDEGKKGGELGAVAEEGAEGSGSGEKKDEQGDKKDDDKMDTS